MRLQWPLVALLAVAAAIRALAMVAYPPALFFNDSWGYVFTAFTGHPVSLSYLRPNGYPVLIHVLSIPGRDLVQLVALQHLSGLVTGALVYVTLTRVRVPRVLAALAAALILLDGYLITLEQYVMPEAFFTLTLLLAAVAVAWPNRSYRWPAIAGVLLAAAAIQREAALFALPAFVIYLLWAHPRRSAVIAFGVTLALPVLAYAALYDARLGVFGLSETSGWTLYGRVAAFADCDGANIPRSERRLCESSAQRSAHPSSPTWYIWDGSAPAARLFHGGHQTRQIQERADRELGNFARRIIAHQPLDYARTVGADFVRYFTPGATPFNDAVSATSLPARASREPDSEQVRRRVLPHMHPAVRSPASFVRSYRDAIHVPRPVLILLALLTLVALALRVQARREILLFAGSGFALVLGTAATAGFGIRYLIPTVPLFAIGGSLALWDLIQRSRSRSRGSDEFRGREGS